ncbi:MAG: 2-amino-4-hydroxy-6-hydroxymethyldihydropteridine diphosphokinase [Planctomycetes bacterium]|nr:2-amino-4-hydroxy-6-hydroxymethyldihydropteridine diphosphokinase [Planctomycetota bacterium]
MTETPNSPALAYVSVGSNIEPEHHIEAALGLLMNRALVTAVSMFYQTEPIGRPEQDPYLNGVFEILTDLPAREVTPVILDPIETQLGRVRSRDKFAPRTMDLDLILYNDVEINTSHLRLPHPDLARPFVAGPVRELLTRETLSHTCKHSMLDMRPCLQRPQTIGLPMKSFSRSLKMKLSRE